MLDINLFDKVILVILSLSLPILAWEGLEFYWTKMRIKNGNYPQAIERFPAHEVTQETYRAAKQKVEDFLDRTLAGEDSKISLCGADLNSLVSKGYPLNKYQPGTYLHYKINEDSIEETYLQWPSFPGVRGCWTRIARIKFDKDEFGQPRELYQIVMEAERAKKAPGSYKPLERSAVVRSVLGLYSSPSFLLNTDSGTVDYQRSMAVMARIKDVTISDMRLHISSCSNLTDSDNV